MDEFKLILTDYFGQDRCGCSQMVQWFLFSSLSWLQKNLFILIISSNSHQFSSVAPSWQTAARQASLSSTNSQSLLKLMSIVLVMPSNHSSSVIPFSSCLQSFPASGSFPMSQFFASGGQSTGSFSFSFSPSNKYLGLISFRMDWLDLLAVQGALKSLLQHHSWKTSILQHSAFFIVQLSHPYMTTGKTIALTRWTFVGKVMSLLFNMLSRLVIAFLPRSDHLLISWLQSPSAGILEHTPPHPAPKNKTSHCFHCFPIYFPWSDGTGCHDISFLNVEF